MPKCPVYMLTGLECPGCGSQRAVHALAGGDVGEAFRQNALFLVMLPVVAVMGYAEVRRRRHPRLYRRVSHPAVILTILAAVTAWTIWRNL